MKQDLIFLLQTFSHNTIELITKLSYLEGIKLDILINLVINYVSSIYTICHTNKFDKEKIKILLDEGVVIILDYIIISKEECLSTEQYKPKYNDAIHFSLQKSLSKIHTPSKHKLHHKINKYTYNCVNLLRDIYLFLVMLELRNAGLNNHELFTNNVFAIEKAISRKLIPLIDSACKHSNYSSSYINTQLGQLLSNSPPPASNINGPIYSTLEQILLAGGPK